MGANMSCVDGSAFTEEGPSGVIKYHSKAKWKAHFDASKEFNKLLVIYFTATWCGPCHFMAPIIEQFAAKYTDVEFVKIDVDQLAEVAKEFGVEGMPTFVLVKKGQQIGKVEGAQKDELQKVIEKHRAY